MLNTTQRLLTAGFATHAIHDADLTHLMTGTPSSRHALINKALKARELIRLRRGLYIANPPLHLHTFSQYYLANHMVPYSFVTAESALSFHGWIPERVTEILSLSAFGRSKRFDTPRGQFTYHVTPIPASQFLMGVERVPIGDAFIWMATPLRATLDFIQWHKEDHVDIDFLQHSLRIEPESLMAIKTQEIEQLFAVYHSRRIQRFLKILTHFIKGTSSKAHHHVSVPPSH